MALLPRIAICNNSVSTEATIRDITGLYDASENTGGFGSPNDSVTDITAATLTVTNPSGTEYEFNVLSYLPSADLVYFDIVTITQTSAGVLVIDGSGTAQLTEGIYTFDYELVGPGGTVTQVMEHYIHYTTTQCVKGMFAELDIADCSCDTDAVEKALYAWGLHEALRSAIQCSKTERITDIQAALTKICNNNC